MKLQMKWINFSLKNAEQASNIEKDMSTMYNFNKIILNVIHGHCCNSNNYLKRIVKLELNGR